MRFNLNSDTLEGAIDYLRNRALQIAHTGAKLTKLVQVPKMRGMWAIFEYEGHTYYALYLLKQHRGNGLFFKLWLEKCAEIGYDVKMITTTQCELASYFRHKKIPFVLANGLTNTEEYQFIQTTYGDKTTMRSGVSLMNHIDEGLYILHKLNASTEAKLGYILHPLFQSDVDLELNFNSQNLKKLDAKSLILAIEYRSVANEYLSHRTINLLDDIRLSPLEDVNVMLKADKIQNRKDFELYHLGTHPRSLELDNYFHNWFNRLQLEAEFYMSCKAELESLSNMTPVLF